MNYISAGESHGEELTVIVDGVPAGLKISLRSINADLARRQAGYGRGSRQLIETDTAHITSGIRFGRSMGSPIAIRITNRDWQNWEARMSPFGEPATDEARELTPRPGHADLSGFLRTNADDCRNVLERASARETAARVAAAGIAREFLAELGVEVFSYVTSIGGVELPEEDPMLAASNYTPLSIESSEVRCPNEEATQAMKEAIDDAREAGDTLGGTFRVVATGLVPGLGGYANPRERLTSRIGAAVLSIPAVRGAEFGLGFKAARLRGSDVHDEIVSRETFVCAMGVSAPADSSGVSGVSGAADSVGASGSLGAGADAAGATASGMTTARAGENTTGTATEASCGITHASNNAGGIEGGMTNGMPLVITAAMKPIPSLAHPLSSINLDTLEKEDAFRERADICAVGACAVVAESEVAFVLANAYIEAFGNTNMADIKASLRDYKQRINTMTR